MATKTKKSPTIDDLRKALPQRERRDVPSPISLRAVAGEPRIAMSIPFNTPSLDMGFTEIIAPGAFARSIKNGQRAKHNGDIVALWNHDSSMVLGRQTNGTLDLAESDTGLEAEVTLAPDQIGWHRDALASIARRDVVGSSFGFETVKDEWDYAEDGSATRTLIEAKLFDVSPVTYPAYPDSNSEQRSVLDAVMVQHRVDVRELAALLNAAEGGTVPQDKAEALRAWIARLTGFVPAPAAPPVDWRGRLALRERAMR
jgi:HK97 family phage prohead protease